MSKIEHLLVAVDFDDASRHALDYALGMAAALGARVSVVHAYEMPMYPVPEDGMVELPVETGEELERRNRERMRHFLADVDHRGVQVDPHVAEGQPDVVACELADRLGCDLLVAGTHGRHGLAHFILGSTAERIVRNAQVPVLTVRG